MTDAPPPDTALPPAPEAETGPGGGAPPVVRKPRKRFILIGLGIGLLIILLIGLLTSIGTSSTTTSAPRQGGPVPSFSGANLGPTGSSQVSVPADGGGNGTPAVLLFFGAWCPSCHAGAPAAGGRGAQAGPGRRCALADPRHRRRQLRQDLDRQVLHPGGGSDVPGGVRPGGRRSPAVSSTSDGDPYAVFVNGDGTIAKIVRGAVLTPSSLTADERALIPSGT